MAGGAHLGAVRCPPGQVGLEVQPLWGALHAPVAAGTTAKAQDHGQHIHAHVLDSAVPCRPPATRPPTAMRRPPSAVRPHHTLPCQDSRGAGHAGQECLPHDVLKGDLRQRAPGHRRPRLLLLLQPLLLHGRDAADTVSCEREGVRQRCSRAVQAVPVAAVLCGVRSGPASQGQRLPERRVGRHGAQVRVLQSSERE